MLCVLRTRVLSVRKSMDVCVVYPVVFTYPLRWMERGSNAGRRKRKEMLLLPVSFPQSVTLFRPLVDALLATIEKQRGHLPARGRG